MLKFSILLELHSECNRMEYQIFVYLLWLIQSLRVCRFSLWCLYTYIFFSLGFRSSLGAIREIGFKFPANKHTCISCTRTRLDYKLDRKMVCLTPCIRLIFKTCVSSIIFFIRVYHYMNMSLTQLVFCFELYILLGFFL